MICAWLSTHDPLPAQRAALAAYDIRVIRTRPATLIDAWLDILGACNMAPPALLVPIMHHAMLTPMVLRVSDIAPACRIVRPQMYRPALDAPWIWEGGWLAYQVVQRGAGRGTIMRPWQPEVVQ